MTTSVDVVINPDTWVDISGTAVNGSFSNEGSRQLIYREAAAAPAASVDTGHTLAPKAGVSFILGAGQEIYARSKEGAGLVVVTLD